MNRTNKQFKEDLYYACIKHYHNEIKFYENQFRLMWNDSRYNIFLNSLVKKDWDEWYSAKKKDLKKYYQYISDTMVLLNTVDFDYPVEEFLKPDFQPHVCRNEYAAKLERLIPQLKVETPPKKNKKKKRFAFKKKRNNAFGGSNKSFR
jgi:hypothetical protein